MFAEPASAIEYRLDVCYNNAEMYLAYFIRIKKQEEERKTNRGIPKRSIGALYRNEP